MDRLSTSRTCQLFGSKAYVYKPPMQQETVARGRNAKHIDHCIGPGTISHHLGTRSAVVSIKDKNGSYRKRMHTNVM